MQSQWRGFVVSTSLQVFIFRIFSSLILPGQSLWASYFPETQLHSNLALLVSLLAQVLQRMYPHEQTKGRLIVGIQFSMAYPARGLFLYTDVIYAIPFSQLFLYTYVIYAIPFSLRLKNWDCFIY